MRNLSRYKMQLIVVSVSLLLGAVVQLKDMGTALKTYSLSSIPVVIGGCALLYYASKDKYSKNTTYLALVFSLCSLIGITFQSFVEDSPVKLLVLNIFALCGAVALFFLYKLIKEMLIVKGKYIVFLIVAFSATIALYLVLIFFGIDPNGSGVKLWISLFGFTLQLTEIIKLVFLLSITVILTCFSKTKAKVLISSALFCLNFIFLFILHETGTIIILAFTLILGMILFCNTKAGIILFIVFVLGCIFFIYMVFAVNSTFENSNDNSILKIFENWQNRLTRADNSHQDRALLGAINGGLFGCSKNYIIEVFAGGTDFAIDYACQLFGLWFIFVPVMEMLLIIMFTFRKSNNYNIYNTFEYKFSLILTFSIIVQSIVSIGNNASALPCIGVGMPFLSYGGTQLLLNYTLALLIVSGISNYKEKDILSCAKQHLKKSAKKFTVRKGDDFYD